MKIALKFVDDKTNPTTQAKGFIAFHLKEGGIKDKEIEVLSPEKIHGKGADYFVTNTGLLIEATYLVENKEVARNIKWALTVNTINKQIKDDTRFASIKGLHDISTPYDFGVKAAQLKNKSFVETKLAKAVDEIIKAILDGATEVEIFGSKLEIQKISDKDDGTYFSSMGGARSISVANIFHENLKSKFEKSNEQLSLSDVNGQKVGKRILLIVNKFNLLTFDWDLFDGLSYSYKELVESCDNIDEIWFQVEDGKGKFHHKLLYKKSVFLQLENMDFSNMEKDDYDVFAKWFSALEKLDDRKKETLIEALKLLLQDKQAHELFSEPQTRIDMVRYGRWLAENGKLNEADWLVTRFINDPDPIDPPQEDKTVYGNKLHLTIKNATEPDTHSIQTVKGHLAWTVQILATQKDFLLNAYQYTQDILRNTKHLYLVLQWLCPLEQVANARLLLKELSEEKYQDFRKLCFEMLDSYSQYPDIARALVHLFNYIQELDTPEAKVVLDKLEDAEHYDALILYFAIFRERHYKDKKYEARIRNYNPDYAKRKLGEIILNSDKSKINLRSGIAWQIWKVLSNDDKEFETFRPLIDKFFSTPFDNHLHRSLDRIIEDQIDKHPDEAIAWFEKIVYSANEYLKENPNEGHNVWFDTMTGEVLSKIAKKKPEKLHDLIEPLCDMWMKGAMIGTISEVFESYKGIEEPMLKAKTKTKFQKLYLKMKSVNDKLQPVNWD